MMALSLMLVMILKKILERSFWSFSLVLWECWEFLCVEVHQTSLMIVGVALLDQNLYTRENKNL